MRLGLLLDDHPEATYEFRLATGAEIGIPDKFGADKPFCVATIRFPKGRADVTAWKPVAASGTPDEWNILCTKTLGRALKRAGYPDDLKDLKALVLWRQRDAEIAAIRGGTTSHVVPSANAIAAAPSSDPMQVALDEAGVANEEATGGDEEADIVDVSPSEVIDDETLNEITELVGGLDKTEEKVFVAFLKKLGISNLVYASATDAEAILGWFDA